MGAVFSTELEHPQVSKPILIQPPEIFDDSPPLKDLQLPRRIDSEKLHQQDEEICEEVRNCLLKHGYIILNVDDQVKTAVQTSEQVFKSFCLESTTEEKEKSRAPQPEISRRPNRWYIPGPRHEYLKMRINDEPNSYPQNPENLHSAFRDAQDQLMKLASSTLKAIARGSIPNSNNTGEISETGKSEEESILEDGSSSQWIEPILAEQSLKRAHDISSLVTMHYYPANQIESDQIISIEDEKKHQPLREHCDTGMVTLLVVGETEGLEVKDQDSQRWFCAESELRRGDILLIIGKALRRMIDPRIPISPTLHRVRMHRDLHRFSQFLYVTCNMCDV